MNKDLLVIFENVKHWLQHAESKNAMLIGFNGAAVFGLIQLRKVEIISSSSLLSYILLISIILLVLSIITALISFIPKTTYKPASGVEESQDNNLLFFEHLMYIPENKIVELVTSTEEDKQSKINLDLANQIIQISRIASGKFSHFKIAVSLTSAVFIIAIFTIIVKSLYC